MFSMDSGSDEGSTDTETNDEETEFAEDFAPNETADLYLAFGDWKATVSEVIENTVGLEFPSFNPNNYTLEEAEEIFEALEDEPKTVVLWGLASVGKADLGKRQRDLNSHGIGLYEGSARDGYYADVFESLPTIETEGLTGHEVQEFADAGSDAEGIGFRDGEGPLLPVGNGYRVAIFDDGSGDNLRETVEALEGLPEEPSTYDEDEVTTGIDPSDHTVDELEEVIGRIEDAERLEAILANEEDGKDRKTAKEAIESRLESVEGSDSDDGAAVEDDIDAPSEGMSNADFAKYLMENEGMDASEAIERASALA